jgi:hypothetical protein
MFAVISPVGLSIRLRAFRGLDTAQSLTSFFHYTQEILL